jgi:hypothetical protein
MEDGIALQLVGCTREVPNGSLPIRLTRMENVNTVRLDRRQTAFFLGVREIKPDASR